MKNKLLLTLPPLLICFASIAQAVIGDVSLGNLQFSNVVASHNQTFAEQSIDGIYDTNTTYGWTVGWNRDVSDNITWTWKALSAPTLSQGEKVDYYTYTINLYTGWNIANNYLLRSYSLALGDTTNANVFSVIENYQSVSNNQPATTISVDANGLITTTQPNSSAGLGLYDVHTLVFRSSEPAISLRLITTPPAGWTNGDFLLREITGSASATVVPEPSTYALFLGLMSLVYCLTRNGTNRA